MDTIVVALIALLAGAYLFWRFRTTVKGKKSPCECGTCGCAFNCSGSACGSSHWLNIPQEDPTQGEPVD